MGRAWVQVSSGRGPVECELATARLAGLLAEAAQRQALAVEELDRVDGREGARSVLLALEGQDAALQPFLDAWVGTVLWSCRSPLRPGVKRRNWYVGVAQLAEPEPVPEGGALRWETFRGGGPGGQHVNKTESSVRVTHLPTGLSVVARSERSQVQNRRAALLRLGALLAARAAEAGAAAGQARWGQHDALERGNPVRAYSGPEFRLVEGR